MLWSPLSVLKQLMIIKSERRHVMNSLIHMISRVVLLTFQKCSADNNLIQPTTQEVQVCAVILSVIQLSNNAPGWVYTRLHVQSNISTRPFHLTQGLNNTVMKTVEYFCFKFIHTLSDAECNALKKGQTDLHQLR